MLIINDLIEHLLKLNYASVDTKTKLFINLCVDHEPPECVTLSAYVQLPDSSAECIATEEFTYFLDQTCYLAKYLADRSV